MFEIETPRCAASSLGLLAAIALAGCSTSLKVDRLEQDGQAGVTYYLPAKQLKVSAVFVVTGCKLENGKVELAHQMSATVSDEQYADLTQSYSISYAELAAATKTTELEVTLTEAGTLSAVNASAKDQTGEIVANVAGAVFGIARAAAIGSPGIATFKSVPDDDPKASKKGCSPELMEKLKRLGEAQQGVKNAKIDEAMLELALGARSKAAGELLKRRAALEAARQPPVDEGKLKDADAALAAAQAAFDAAHLIVLKHGRSGLNQALAELSEAREALSVRAFGVCRPVANDPHCAPITVGDAAAAALASNSAEKEALMRLRAGIEVGAEGSVQLAKASEPVKHPAGLVYRLPAHLRVVVRDGTGGTTDSAAIAYDAIHAFPQLGRLAVLPLKNGPFEDNSISVVFGSSGQLQKLSFKTNSSAAAAAGTAKGISEAYLEFVKSRAKDLRDEEAAQLELESKRRDARVDSLKDRVETLKLLEALEQSRAGTASQSQRKLDALSTRKQELDLLIEIRKREDELKKLAGG